MYRSKKEGMRVGLRIPTRIEHAGASRRLWVRGVLTSNLVKPSPAGLDYPLEATLTTYTLKSLSRPDYCNRRTRFLLKFVWIG